MPMISILHPSPTQRLTRLYLCFPVRKNKAVFWLDERNFELSIFDLYYTCYTEFIWTQLLAFQHKVLLLELFKNVKGCTSDSPKVVYIWRIRHGCGIKSEESAQLSWKPQYCIMVLTTSHFWYLHWHLS